MQVVGDIARVVTVELDQSDGLAGAVRARPWRGCRRYGCIHWGAGIQLLDQLRIVERVPVDRFCNGGHESCALMSTPYPAAVEFELIHHARALRMQALPAAVFGSRPNIAER